MDCGRECDRSKKGGSFPYEALPVILKKLSMGDLASPLCVSKAFYAEAFDLEVWRNATLSFSEGSVSSKLSSRAFLKLLARAKGELRTNIQTIDLSACNNLDAWALEGIVRAVDFEAKPPKYINVSNCQITSRELVAFLSGLAEELETEWIMADTRLVFDNLSAVYERDAGFLQKFDITQVNKEGHDFHFKCGRCKTGLNLQRIRFCGRCGAHLCWSCEWLSYHCQCGWRPAW
jgi:hypothetical protein